MENLKEIAIGAMTGHWPAHLGLKTDAERIEFLARAVEKLVDELEGHEELQEREAA